MAGTPARSPMWVSFSHEEIDLHSFLSSVDFFVYQPDAHTPGLMDAPVVEALASGCVVLLPPQLAAAFPGVIVSTGTSAPERVVRRVHGDPAALATHSRRGVAWVRKRHSVERVVETVRNLVQGR